MEAETVQEAMAAQAADPSLRLGEVLIRLGHVSEEQLTRCLAESRGIPFVKLRANMVQAEALTALPADFPWATLDERTDQIRERQIYQQDKYAPW